MNIKLQYHKELNSKLWKDDALLPEVRNKLLLFAKTWQQFADIPDEAVTDIIMTGGNANYNYTPQSDIDIHILIDKSKLPEKGKYVDDDLYSKKIIWTLTHDVKVLGYPLEPYAQDKDEIFPKGQGVFSLKNNKWVIKPVFLKLNFKDDDHLKRKVSYYMKMIDHMISSKMSLSAFETLMKKITASRKTGIVKAGEYSFENLVFKELRNQGYINKLDKYIRNSKDKELSL